MTAYTIANLPTQYRGRMYRSRLEARWAAFFDRLGWTHEYEPFDLGKWSPDFAITDPIDALVEVKPATTFDPDVAEKVNEAAEGSGCFYLLTRVAPVKHECGLVQIGWWTVSYREAFLFWRPSDKPAFQADIFSYVSDLSWWVTASRDSGQDGSEPALYPYADHTMNLWADACNAVQWEPAQ